MTWNKERATPCSNRRSLAMMGTVLVLVLASVAAITDLCWQKIYNVTTYPGILAALALAGLRATGIAGSGSAAEREWLARVELSDSVVGLLACGGLMVLCYVWFGIGGGDVKLLAMLGAFLGLEQGLEALLWTFVLGGCLGLVVLVWKIGAVELAQRALAYLGAVLRVGPTPPVESDRQVLSAKLSLGPCTPVAVAIVVFEWF
jgi:prepilin peptidase CpaA